jgi:UDP-N-acetylglucosamine 2-epimerase (non-hydrolysing)
LAPRSAPSGLRLEPPLSYLEFLSLMDRSRLVLTDSGGIQEETTALGVPCLTLRENTEWPATISEGTNRLIGSRPSAVIAAADRALRSAMPRQRRPRLWDGRAAERIARICLQWFRGRG